MEQSELKPLLEQIDSLHGRHLLAGNMPPDYFEPGMMEYPAQYDGSMDAQTGCVLLRFEVKGTRYDGRTEQIEKVRLGAGILVERDAQNAYNPNNFVLLTEKHVNVGNMPAELCNAIAPLYDAGTMVIDSAAVSYVEPLSKRNRHAKQAVLFVEMKAHVTLQAEN